MRNLKEALLLFWFLSLFLAQAKRSSSSSSSSSSSQVVDWSFLGPFIVGKTEIDADPLSGFPNCTRIDFLRKRLACLKDIPSELSEDGYVHFHKLDAFNSQGVTHVTIQYPNSFNSFNFNQLVQGLNKIAVLEFQGWVTATISVPKTGTYMLDLSPIHSFYVDGDLFAGNIYSESGYSGGTILQLKRGTHFLDIRVRAKGSLTFSCSLKLLSTSSFVLRLSGLPKGNEITDLLEGQIPFGPTSWMQLPVTNTGKEWLREISFEVVRSSADRPTITVIPATSSPRIAPGHTQLIPFQIKLQPNSSNKKEWWKGLGEKCLSFTVEARATGSSGGQIRSDGLELHVNCRYSLQSFVFTFLDHDGSVAHAAAIQPIEATSAPAAKTWSVSSILKGNAGSVNSINSYPVLLTLSGVGVSARSQADSHKYKAKPSDSSYSFGHDRMWVLAPQRDGAHNWEGTGLWTAVSALEYLTDVSSRVAPISDQALRPADASSVVVSGHSRGGHGALTFTTHMPDRVRAVISASGYSDRENYGDANILFDVDMQLPYLDPQLLAVHLATIMENDNSQLAANIFPKDVFVRSGSADRTVNVYFQRAILRYLTTSGINVTYSEKPGADHWYWDFDHPEDGGVVYDPLTRRFIAHHAFRASETIPLQFTIHSSNPATFESKFGLRILNLKSRLNKGTIKAVKSATGCKLTTSNVMRFHVNSTRLLGGEDAVLTVDRTSFQINVSTRRIHCFKKAATGLWIECVESQSEILRSAEEYGPARQAFHAPFLIIAGTGENSTETCPAGQQDLCSAAVSGHDLLSAAKYISNGHRFASSTVSNVVLDNDVTDEALQAMLVEDRVNLILIGGPRHNSASKRIIELSKGEFVVGFESVSSSLQTVYEISGCAFEEEEQGIMFTFPLPYLDQEATAVRSHRRNRLGLMIDASTSSALQDVIYFSYSSNTPLTRAPFSNMYGDLFVTGPEFRQKGLGGLQASGFWNNEWKLDSENAWKTINCDVKG